MKLFLVLLFCPVFCCSQNIRVDKLTGDTTIISDFEKLYNKASFSGTVGEQLKVAVSKDKEGFKLGLWIQTGKSLSFEVGGSLQMKMENGDVLEIAPLGTGANEISPNFNGGTTISLFRLTSEQFDKLRGIKVAFIRISAGDVVLDYDIKEKFQNVIIKCAAQISKFR